MYKIIFYEDQNKHSEVLEYIQMLDCKAASNKECRIFGKESNMATWKEVREHLSLTTEDECIIAIEKQLIRNMVKIREEKGWTQSELAENCKVKQPTIARMESNVHSPQLDSLLRVLTSLGYTLQIVPMSQSNQK